MQADNIPVSMLIKISFSWMERWIIGWMFEHLNFLLPVERVYESRLLLAFNHPKPVYPIHILIVPKKAIRDLSGLINQPEHYRSKLLEDLLRCVGDLVYRMNLEASGYRLIVNWGSYQDVKELHFHLVSGETPTRQVAEFIQSGKPGS